MIEHSKIEHSRMVEYYRQNDQVKNFIIKFFKVRKGIRARVIQDYTTKGKVIRYYWLTKNLETIDENNFWDQMNISGTLFFYEMIFDKRTIHQRTIFGNRELAFKSESGIYYDRYKLRLESSVIGASTVFDIDAPNVNGRKVDFFEMWEEFDQVKVLVEEELQELGIKFNCMFSGNGIYVICQSMYFDEIEKMKVLEKDFAKMDMYNDSIDATIMDINKKLEMDGLKVGIDSGAKHWAKYHKAPFTYQPYRERISVPIPEGKIDINWLNQVSDAKIFFDSNNVADSIIKIADWKNIWRE